MFLDGSKKMAPYQLIMKDEEVEGEFYPTTFNPLRVKGLNLLKAKRVD